MKKNDYVRAKINVKVTTGEMLKALRELKGLSQNSLAELTGMSQSNISAIENNTRRLGKEGALLFAKALKVHPAVILFPDFDISEVA